MKVTFTNLTADNFLSFRHMELKLDNTGYYLVKGINNSVEDHALSNGSGKSSIWEAIIWCLTGETIRGSKEVSMIGGDSGATVELTFSVDFVTYTIIRKKDPSGLKIFVNGEDKSAKGIRDTEKLLAQYLPDMTSTLIGSVIILGQGLPHRFTNNTPSGRKEVLEKLSKSNFMVEELKEQVASRKNELSNSLRKAEDESLLLNNNLEHIAQTKLDIQNKLNVLKPVEEQKIRLSDLEKQCKQIEEEIDRLTSDIQEANKKGEEFTDKRQALTEEYAEEQKKVTEEFHDQEVELSSGVKNSHYEINSLKAEIKRLESITDICPTCGQKLQGVTKPDTSTHKEKLASLEASEKELTKKLTDLGLEKDHKLYELQCKYHPLLKELDENAFEWCGEADFDTKCKQEKEALHQSLIIDIEKLKKEIEFYSGTKEGYQKELEQQDLAEKEFLDKRLYNNKEREDLSNRLSIVSRMMNALNKEFRGYLLINVIDFINNKAKEYCQKIFDTDKIEFKQEGNNISISYCGKEYENLSGGEKQKIDLIVQFAIRDMLSKYLNFSSNILVLDEIVDFLDAKGVEKVVDFITTTLKDTSAIYFITHHDNLMFPYDGEVVVTKESDGVSKVCCK